MWRLWTLEKCHRRPQIYPKNLYNPHKKKGCSELKGYVFCKETPSVSLEMRLTSQSPTTSTSTFFCLSSNRPSNRSWKLQPRETRCLPQCCSSGTRWSSWRSLGHCLAIFSKLECSDAEKVQNRKIWGHQTSLNYDIFTNAFLEIHGEPEVGPALKAKYLLWKHRVCWQNWRGNRKRNLWETWSQVTMFPRRLCRDFSEILKNTGLSPKRLFLLFWHP